MANKKSDEKLFSATSSSLKDRLKQLSEKRAAAALSESTKALVVGNEAKQEESKADFSVGTQAPAQAFAKSGKLAQRHESIDLLY